MNTSMKVMTGFLAGAAVGAIAGLLLAPESGSEIRKKMSKESKRLTDEFGDALNKTLDRVKTTYNEKLEQYAEDSKTGIDSMKEKMRLTEKEKAARAREMTS